MEAKLNITAGKKDDLPDVPYAKLVCDLLIIARCTRPNVTFSVTLMCRYLTDYNAPHCKAAIRVLTYIKCTMDFRLAFFGIPVARWRTSKHVIARAKHALPKSGSFLIPSTREQLFHVVVSRVLGRKTV
jgi:hypothetical protein